MCACRVVTVTSDLQHRHWVYEKSLDQEARAACRQIRCQASGGRGAHLFHS